MTGQNTDSAAVRSTCSSNTPTRLVIALTVSIYSWNTICWTGSSNLTVSIQRKCACVQLLALPVCFFP